MDFALASIALVNRGKTFLQVGRGWLNVFLFKNSFIFLATISHFLAVPRAKKSISLRWNFQNVAFGDVVVHPAASCLLWHYLRQCDG